MFCFCAKQVKNNANKKKMHKFFRISEFQFVYGHSGFKQRHNIVDNIVWFWSEHNSDTALTPPLFHLYYFLIISVISTFFEINLLFIYWEKNMEHLMSHSIAEEGKREVNTCL